MIFLTFGAIITYNTASIWSCSIRPDIHIRKEASDWRTKKGWKMEKQVGANVNAEYDTNTWCKTFR